MSNEHEEVPQLRPWQRWRYRAPAAVGLAVILGSSLLAAQQGGSKHAAAGADQPAGTVEASDPPSSAAASPSGSASGSASPAASASASASPATSHRPSAKPAAAVSVAPVTVTTTGSLPKDHHTMRIVSAHADLTGQRELAWAADSGHPVGAARCTQNFRFNPQSPAGIRPTMLMCWRTSQAKSVYVISVDLDHKPSEQAATAVLSQTWNKLG